MNVRTLIGLALVLFAVQVVPPPARAGSAAAGSLWDPTVMIDHHDVKAGMKGYGKSVFRGTTIEKFGVTVLGVLEKTSFGSDLVLVRIDSGPPVSEDYGVVAGMSGSPIYLQTGSGEKLLGALAYAWPFAKKPIAGITPIRQMCETLEPESTNSGLRNADSGFATGGLHAREPIEVEGRRVQHVQVLPSQSSIVNPQSSMTLVPVATPLMVSGLGSGAFRRFQKFMEPFNIIVAASPGIPVFNGQSSIVNPQSPMPPLEPGSAVGVQLMSGDIDLSGIGTVTYVKDGRVLAFGHPMLMLGTGDVPMTNAYIHSVMSSVMISTKMGAPVDMVGRITQDRQWAIGGSLGAPPEMLEAQIRVHDVSRSYEKSYRAKVFRHKLLEPLLLQMAIDGALDVVDSPFAETTKRVRFEVKPVGLPAVRRENIFTSGGRQQAPMFFGMGAGGPTSEIAETIDLLANNKFRAVKIERVTVDVEIEETRRSGNIESVTLSKTRVKPGETVEAKLRIRPLESAAGGATPFIETVSLVIPPHMPTGPAQVLIAGGRSAFMMKMGLGLRLTAPVSLEQTLDLLGQREQNNRLYVTLTPMMPSAVEISGSKLSFLPQSLIEMLRGTQPAAVRLARDELTQSLSFDFVVNGAQVVTLFVESDDREKVNPFFGGFFGGPQQMGMMGPGFGDGGPNLSGFDDPFDDSYDDFDFAMHARRLVSVESETSVAWMNRWAEAWAKVGGSDPLAVWGTRPNHAERLREWRRLLGGAMPAPPLGPRPDVTAGNNPFDDDDSSDEESATAPASLRKDNKPVGRAAGVWTQSTERDFLSGKLDGAFVRSDGTVGLAPEIKWSGLETPPGPVAAAPFAQAANDKGVRYVATWIEGQVLRIDANGKSTTLYKCSDPAMTAIAVDKAGLIYAASAPSGVIYKISDDGKGSLFCRLPETYVWALAFDSKGTLFAATGVNGRVYRLDRAGKFTVAAQLPDRHALALTIDQHDNVYAGTYPRGRVYRIAANGSLTTFFDVPRATVQSLAADHDGNVYVGTSPHAVVYRVTPEGVATEVIKTREKHVLSLTTDRNGCVYASTGPRGKVYCIAKDKVVTSLLHSDEPYLVALTEVGAGHIVATTGNNDRTLEIGPAARSYGTFTSAVKDCGSAARWGRITWTGEGALTLQTRSGNTAFPDANWSDWSPACVEGDDVIASPPARYLQYRVNLYSVSEAMTTAPARATTVLKHVSIFFVTRNRAPLLALKAPQGGERWSKTKTITWNAYDPDGDTLAHKVYYSNDGGKTWSEIVEEKRDETAAIKKATDGKDEIEAETKKKVEELRNQLKDALKEKFPEIEPGSVIRRKPGPGNPTAAGAPAPPRQNIERPQQFYPPYGRSGDMGGPDEEGYQRDPLNEQPPVTRKWDTSKLPDGTYLIKVVVDDKRSNPKEGLSVEKISRPIIIDNMPPRVVTTVAITDKPTQPIRVQVEDDLSYIASVDYKIDDEGDWVAAAPVKGILDSVKEEVELDPAQIIEGKHTLHLRVRDAAGNETVQKIEYTWGKVEEKAKPADAPAEAREDADKPKSKEPKKSNNKAPAKKPQGKSGKEKG